MIQRKPAFAHFACVGDFAPCSDLNVIHYNKSRPQATFFIKETL